MSRSSKQSATDALKTASKTTVQKTAEATDYLIGNTNAEEIEKVSRGLLQSNSEVDKKKQKAWNLIEKYQRKDDYLQKKVRKLLMI